MKKDVKDFLDKKIKDEVEKLKVLKKSEFGTLKWKKIWDKVKYLKTLRYKKDK